MNLELIRYNHDKNSTQGLLLIDSKPVCFVLEDEERAVKIHGETRIPAGVYEIKKREQVTPLTKTYRDKFSFFDYHLEIQDIPNFKYVYIHIGNWPKDTEGCLLVGMGAKFDPEDNVSMITDSTKAFALIYPIISDALANGKVFLTIKNL